MEMFFDSPASGHGCASLVDLQHQLGQLLNSKVTPTKAEHISSTFELRSNVAFSVPVTEQENASLEAGGGVDPQLFGGARAGSTALGHDGQLLRHINALDAVLNQSQDDPVIQRIVAKHIMAGVEQADQSQWIMRSMTRATQGWTFTYGCKDSAQTWARQDAKQPAKTAIAEWSSKDGQDPINLSRPAFDCRGTLTVSFSKADKTISVKYEHTNMHKTVGELLDLLVPPPPRPYPVLLEGLQAVSKKTPKKRQTGQDDETSVETPGGDGATPRRKKLKKSTQDGEQPSKQKKRQRKIKADADAPGAPAPGSLALELSGIRSGPDTARHSLHNTQAPSNGNSSAVGHPNGLTDGEAFNGSEAQASAMVSSSLHANSILNLPAGEAERRREAAIRLLAESNVDPMTLTAEQFSIFANQAPALQQDSLQMLMKYGAERLRIVLPDKDQNAPEHPGHPSSDPVPGQPPSLEAPPPASAPDPSPKRKRKASRKRTEAGGTDAHAASDTAPLTYVDTASQQGKAKAPQISRGACTPCRASRTKCGKEKPSCGQCLNLETACSYPLEQSRKSKAMEDVTEGEAEEPDARQTEQHATTSSVAAHGDDEPDELPYTGFRYEDPGAPPPDDSVHQPEVVNGSEPQSMGHKRQSSYGGPGNGIYHHASGLTFPDSISPEITHQLWPSAAPTDYNDAALRGSTNNGLDISQQTGDTSKTPFRAGTNQQQKAWGSYTTSQPPATVQAPTTNSSLSTSAGHGAAIWQGYSHPAAASTNAASASPNQSRRTVNHAGAPPYIASTVPDKVPQGSASSQGASNHVPSRTASTGQTHYEAAATVSRAKSRQGLKSQTRTPVPNQPSRQPQHSAPAASGGYSQPTTDKTSASDYNNAYSHYSTGADQASNSLPYQPYSQQNMAATTSSVYPSYDSYGNPSQRATNHTPHLNSPAAHNVASSYPSSSPAFANKWDDAPSQRRSNPSFTPSSATSALSAANLRPSSSRRPQIPSSFNVRPQAPANTPSQTAAPSASYGNAYSSYASQAQQQPGSSQQQQGWYTGSSTSGYGTGPARSSNAAASTGFSSTGAGGGDGASHGGAQYGQQHQQAHAPAQNAMNLSGHAYNSMGSADQGIYDLLPGGGSGH